jgi:hypothetical protein
LRISDHFLIAATFASAEYGALHPTLITLAIFLQTLRLLTLATFPDLIRLHPQTKPLRVLIHTFSPFLLLKPMSISGQGLNNRLLVLLPILLLIPAPVTIAIIRAKQLLLKTLAVELQTP